MIPAPGRTSRRAFVGALGLALAGAVALAPRAAEATRTRSPLFRIERSTNANYVQYDAVVLDRAALDPKSPIVAYWILAAKDGRREALSAIEHRAYGFRVVAEGDGRWLLVLRAARDRSIRVLRWGGRWVAQVAIAKRSAVLERLYVEVDEGGVLPRVRWVDLFGRDMETQEPLHERITA